jgi:hypothetical protein
MPVILNFTLTFEDYQNALRLHARKNWWLCLNYFAARFVLPALGVLLILLALLISGHSVPSPLAIFNFGLGVFFVLYPWYYRARLKRCYRRTRTGSEQSVELGEELIRMVAENTSSELTWKAVQFVREDQNVFMLYLAPAKFIALPKRAFTPEQISELEELLTRKVQRNH